MNEQSPDFKDLLTGFHNKQSLFNYLDKKLKTVASESCLLTVIILDLDNFKSINDTHGHMVGDDAIKHFAKVINAVLYGQHFIARYGGDEFVIVLYGKHKSSEGEKIASEVQQALKVNPIKVENKTIELKSSIGVCDTRGEIEETRALIEKADEALYTAKQRGRNRVISAENVVSQKKIIKISSLTKKLIYIAIGMLLLSGLMSLRNTKMFKNFVSDDYYYIQLKNGQALEGWMVEDQQESIKVNLLTANNKKNTLEKVPIYYDYFTIYSDDVLDVSLDELKSMNGFTFGKIMFKDQKMINAWINNSMANYLIVTFSKPNKPLMLPDSRMYNLNEPLIIPKSAVISYIKYQTN